MKARARKRRSEKPVAMPVALPETAALTPLQVKEYLGVSERTVERLDLPWCVVGVRCRRILGRDLVAWLSSQRKAG